MSEKNRDLETKATTSAQSTLQSQSRRTAVKTIVGGVSAIAAYNMLPAKWGTPIIEHVFLPAHAATSGTSLSDPCNVSITKGDQSTSVHFSVTGFVVPAISGLPVNLEITTIGGPDAGTATYSSSMTGLITDENGEFSQDFGNWAAGTQRIKITSTVTGADGSASCAADVPASQNSGSSSDSSSDVDDSTTFSIGPIGMTANTALCATTGVFRIGRVHGSVSASDSRDLADVVVNIQIASQSFQATVITGNTYEIVFGDAFFNNWVEIPLEEQPFTITVNFADQARYGTAFSRTGDGCPAAYQT